MSQQSADVIASLYASFGRGDIPAILATVDEHIDWRCPDNLPHGGEFHGREGVERFFTGLGEQWDDLDVAVEDVLATNERVIVLARLHGHLRASGEEAGYASAHAWTVRDGSPIRFVEYVDAPLTLPVANPLVS